MAKILVTGASGFVGRNLVPALIKAGHEVRCAVTQKVDSLLAEQVLVDKLELQSDWSEILQGIEVVIHLAARVHIMKDKVANPLEEYCKINSKATKNLAEQAAKHQVKRFIFLSSIKVNGGFTLDGVPFTEESTVQPEDAYGESKWYAEQYLQLISQKTQMQIVILRPPLVYGPEVKANFFKMLQLVNKGWPLPFKNIQNRRSFIFIDNLISAICTVVTEPKAANQLYLVADDGTWSLTNLLVELAQKMNVKLRLFSIPGIIAVFKLFGLANLNQRLFGSLEVCNNKLKTQLGWNPPVSSADGLSKTVKWYKNEHNS